MRELVISAVMLLGAFGLVMSAGVHRESPLVGHETMTSEISHIEAEVARYPERVEALATLCRAYLDRNAPGPALAAIRHAPGAVRAVPLITHLWARALLHAGHASEALAKQRETLQTCSRMPCSAWLHASALRHVSFLRAMVDIGVEDYRRDPAKAVRAYESLASNRVAVLASAPR
jgi:hypothetical protein